MPAHRYVLYAPDSVQFFLQYVGVIPTVSFTVRSGLGEKTPLSISCAGCFYVVVSCILFSWQ